MRTLGVGCERYDDLAGLELDLLLVIEQLCQKVDFSCFIADLCEI